MQAGKLRHRVTIQERQSGSPQQSSSGAPDEAWTTRVTAYAAIEPLRGREFLEAQAVQSQVAVRIRIRYRPGITAGMRVVKGSTVYDIQAVLNMAERDAELHLMCATGTSNG